MKIKRPSVFVRKHVGLHAILWVALMAFSCSPLYIPNARTLNHFSSKHEVNATGMIDLAGFTGSTAVSVTDHLAVQGSVSKSIYGIANDRDTSAIGGMEGSHNHRMMQIGVVYYRKIFSRYFEFSGGYSRGKSDVYEDWSSSDGVERPGPGPHPSRVISGAYHRHYLQGGGAIVGGNQAKLGFIVRVSSVKFSQIHSQTKEFAFDKKNRYFFLEPAIDVRLNIYNTPLYVLGNIGVAARIDNIPRKGTSRGDVPEVWVINNTFGIGVHLTKTKRSRE